jgi:osmotically-inducible protein OsmY
MMNKPLLLMVPVFALGAALAGCNRSDDQRTAGQRVDETAARTQDAAKDATNTTRDAAQEVKKDIAEAGARAADAVSDATITAQVKSALAADPQLSALRIDVDTSNGVVTLRGPAPDEKARSRATQLAAASKGVMRVENKLELKTS